MNEAKTWNRKITHPLQSWEWGEFRKLRQPISRINGFLIVWTKIPPTPWCFGYIPMGKIPNAVEVEAIKAEAVRQGGIGVRMEPNVSVQSGKFKVQSYSQKLKKGRSLFKKKTLILNLEKTEEELLKAMHPKGRYNIRVAQKHGVKVEIEETEAAFSRYLELMFTGTAKRQKIYAHGPKYHRQMWDSLRPAGMVKLFCAKYQKRIIACALIFCFKGTIYYAYGASALEHKEVMAPTLLLWKIARWGKHNGYKYFDLWGTEEGKGFARFKEQFGAETVELPGSFDLPVNKYIYPLFRIAEEVRWRLIHIWK